MRKIGVLGIAFIGLSLVASAPGLLLFTTIILGSTLSGGGRWSASILAAAAIGLVPCAIAVALGAWLLASRHRLSARWFDDTPVDLIADPVSVFRPAVALVGLAMSVSATSGLLGSVASLIQRSATPPLSPSPILWLTLLPQNAGQLIALVLGLVLIFKSKAVGRWLLGNGDDAEQVHPDGVGSDQPGSGAVHH